MQDDVSSDYQEDQPSSPPVKHKDEEDISEQRGTLSIVPPIGDGVKEEGKPQLKVRRLCKHNMTTLQFF